MTAPVSTLTGPLLARAVAMALGLKHTDDLLEIGAGAAGDGSPVTYEGARGDTCIAADGLVYTSGVWRPHADWAQGGPLIDKYNIDTGKAYCGGYYAQFWESDKPGVFPIDAMGETRLIAAMRVLVRAKIGDTMPEGFQP